MERRASERISMSAILRIFKYVRKRLIILSIENKRLKMQLEFYKAIVESDNSKNIDEKKIPLTNIKLDQTKKNNTEEAVITVKTSKSNTYAKEVDILGKSKLVYRQIKPLSCGARVWIETDEKVVLDGGLLTIE